jgi:predicted metal-dependent phosphoesterase TrpH
MLKQENRLQRSRRNLLEVVMIRVDFHTHSVSSPDGSITATEYREALDKGILDCVAITDHNEIEFAVELQREIGTEKIIVGEEITTVSGEIIGLFLKKRIKPHQSVEETIAEIKKQGGVVYIPHPFETVRKGVSMKLLNRISHTIDVIETANGRALFQNKGPKAYRWARQNKILMAASSDAHHAPALGKTFTLLSEIPTAKTLGALLSTARKQYKRPSAHDVLAPKRSNLMKKIGKL